MIAHLLLLAALGTPAASSQKKGAEALAEAARLTPLHGPHSPRTAMTPSDAPIQIQVGPYQGWDRALSLRNALVEAVVVPSIGRIQQFRFLGEPGAFWENDALRGQAPDPDSSEWGNFGGDKTWPAPQADWPKITPRAWPPPIAFDSLPLEVFVRGDVLILRSPVDPHYGIRTERDIRLDHHRPVMTVTTTYEKVTGEPVRVGVWIITQMPDPVAVFAPVPKPSLFADGYNRQSGDRLPAGLRIEDGLLSLTRDRQHATKIGLDTDRLLWVGREHMVLIESPRVPGTEYPDQQSSAEIYTNPDPLTYVELEMLGPLATLRPGDRLSQTNTYTLVHRTHPDPVADARHVLSMRASPSP